jgi:exopolysaccharide biosynthesis polyprenyl glycosylphosphotransferase
VLAAGLGGPVDRAVAAAAAALDGAGGGYLRAALPLSLMTTGNYGRRTGLYASLSLLRGSALAVTLIFWLPLMRDGVGGVLVPFAMTVVALAAALWVGRRVTGVFLAGVWPGERGAPPAMLIIGEDRGGRSREEVTSLFRRDYRLVGHVGLYGSRPDDAVGGLDDLAELIDQHAIEAIVVSGALSEPELAEVLDVSLTAGCELLYPARSVKIAGVRPRLIWREDEAFLELGAPVLKAQELLAKRVVDILGSTLGLLLLAPLLALLALLVRLDSPGPVFFEQNRAGLGGRRFRMLKFRTMRVGADEEKPSLAHLNCTGDARLFKIPNDPRVTRLGAWLRRWSLDELPQLWNVLRGDMSLVGPRPFFEADLEAYEDHHFRRLSAKPGITGLWQVNGRSSVVDFEEVVRLDREYIERWSVWLDLYILARTVPAVLGRTGAY